MNYNAVETAHRIIDQRADRIANRIADKARAIGETRAGTGSSFVFHLAYNWQNLDTITADQREACREILRLERRRFRVDAIARAMIDKLWAEYDRALVAFTVEQSHRRAAVSIYV